MILDSLVQFTSRSSNNSPKRWSIRIMPWKKKVIPRWKLNSPVLTLIFHLKSTWLRMFQQDGIELQSLLFFRGNIAMLLTYGLLAVFLENCWPWQATLQRGSLFSQVKLAIHFLLRKHQIWTIKKLMISLIQSMTNYQSSSGSLELLKTLTSSATKERRIT